jgi:A/G-specific adenine glycosylase
MSKFAAALVAWQRRHGRSGLPWQGTRDPYRVWLSEIMLQQTQVAAVIPYYERFLHRFPSIASLASAEEDEVLRLWSGLGYYARARNLHAAARKIVESGGRFPDSTEAIGDLPGIGRSTAAAIAAFAFGRRAAILDGNVKRVLARCFGVEGFPGERTVETRLWGIAERLLPERSVETYTQALMDLGATVCTKSRPRCEACPVEPSCVARKEGRIEQLPAPRPRRPLPQKSVTWLVLRHTRQILLERRPAPGIWGGLWSFPESERPDVVRYCRSAFGARVSNTEKLEPIEHGFTHFHLRIQPVLCAVTSVAPSAEAPGRLWMPLDEASEAAVPAPVRKLVGRLAA